MANENMRFLTIGIGIDLPFMPWNSKRINAMVEEKNVMELQSLSMKSSMYQYMKTELQNMLAMIDILKQKIQYIREIYIPQVRQTFNSSMASYSSGAGEFMNLLDSYREMRKSDEMLIKEETEYLKQLSELEFLLGIPVSKIN
jgi:outer membrane protein TolC